MSGALGTQERPLTGYRIAVGALFAVHRRVVVRKDLDVAIPGAHGGPEYCTCGDVWPCRSEAEAARILDWA